MGYIQAVAWKLSLRRPLLSSNLAWAVMLLNYILGVFSLNLGWANDIPDWDTNNPS
jgi:hypothetical protein